MTQKKFEYVSLKLVDKQYREFEARTLPALESIVAEKYMQYLPYSLLHPITNSVWASLSTSLYLQCSSFKSKVKPSFSQQMCAIHDYEKLLSNTDERLRFFQKMNYWSCYTSVSILLNEKENYQKTNLISNEFWRQLRCVNKENLPPEYAEHYVAFSEEITRALTTSVIDMVSQQIETLFPSESDAYRRSLDAIYEPSNDGLAKDEEPSTSMPHKKITFTL